MKNLSKALEDPSTKKEEAINPHTCQLEGRGKGARAGHLPAQAALGWG